MHEENTSLTLRIFEAVLNFLLTLWDLFLSIFDGVPEHTIAVVVYIFGALFVLFGWALVLAKPFPKAVRQSGTIFLFAFFFTPTISEGVNATLAPAIFGLLFGLITKEMYLFWVNLASIILVMSLGFIVMYCYQYYINRRQHSSYTE